MATTIHHAVSGAPAVANENRLHAVDWAEPGRCLPLAGRFAGYPSGFLESIDKAMEVLPADRFQTADEWLAVLDGLLSQKESKMKLLGRTIGLRRTNRTASQGEATAPAPVAEDAHPDIGADAQPTVSADAQPTVSADAQPEASTDPQPEVSADPQPKNAQTPKLILEGNKMLVDLSGLKEISGFISGCLVDCESGLMLASESVGKFDIETAAAANVDVVRGKQTAIRLLGLNDRIEDILISLGTQLHLIRPLEKVPTMFLYAALDRKTANLGMARLQVKKVEQGIKL